MVERIQTRVKHNGWSYQLNNQIDAVKLESQLKEYEETIKELEAQIRIQDNLVHIKKDAETIKNTTNRILEMIQ